MYKVQNTRGVQSTPKAEFRAQQESRDAEKRLRTRLELRARQAECRAQAENQSSADKIMRVGVSYSLAGTIPDQMSYSISTQNGRILESDIDFCAAAEQQAQAQV